MKKSLIALAAVAASGAAFAQSSVTLFGVVDTSVAYVKQSAPGVDSEKKYGLSNDGIASSRLGFRGVEDLGNGLKAGFWLEAGISPDDGGSSLKFNRRSTIGLEGGFGEVRFGRELVAGHDKPSSYSVMSTIGVAGFQGWAVEDVRYDNMVSYYSPNFAGFSFSANYAFDEKSDANRSGGYAGAQLTYANGPLSVTAAYDQANPVSADGYVENTAAVRTDVDSWTLGASYDFGVVKLSGLYHAVDIEVVGGEKTDFNSWALGVVAPVGAAGKIKAQYARYDADEAGKADQISVGYEHALSKRTAVYGTYAYLKNKNGFDLNTPNKLRFGTTNFTGVENSKTHALQVGVRHAF